MCIRDRAEAGAQVVEKAVRSIKDVHRMSLALKEDMAQLNEHAQDCLLYTSRCV